MTDNQAKKLTQERLVCYYALFLPNGRVFKFFRTVGGKTYWWSTVNYQWHPSRQGILETHLKLNRRMSGIGAQRLDPAEVFKLQRAIVERNFKKAQQWLKDNP